MGSKKFSDKYEGIITLKRAFAISSNVASVRLAEKVGRENIINQTKKLGVTSKISNNPSMALGVDSFSLLETVGSFGAICGYGIPVIPYGIDEIKKKKIISHMEKNFSKKKRDNYEKKYNLIKKNIASSNRRRHSKKSF